jgi:hypothetical protein
LFSIVALATFFIALRGAVPQSDTIECLESLLQSVDLSAFLNLTDPREAEFLRATLPPASYRRLARARIRAALKYLTCLSRNSAVLQRIGELARRSSDQAIADSGRELANTALRTRILILRAYWRLAPQLILPAYGAASDPRILSDYEELKRRFGSLASTQQPLVASRFLSQL